MSTQTTSTAGEAADALHRRRRKERGQSTIELALTLPILLVLLLGLIEFGHAFNSYLTIVAAARDAARLASEEQTATTSLRALIQNETARLPSGNVLVATNDCSATSGGVCIFGITDAGVYDSGDPDNECVVPVPSDETLNSNCVRVKVCYNHPMIVGIPFLTDAKNIRMCSQTTMRLTS